MQISRGASNLSGPLEQHGDACSPLLAFGGSRLRPLAKFSIGTWYGFGGPCRFPRRICSSAELDDFLVRWFAHMWVCVKIGGREHGFWNFFWLGCKTTQTKVPSLKQMHTLPYSSRSGLFCSCVTNLLLDCPLCPFSAFLVDLGFCTLGGPINFAQCLLWGYQTPQTLLKLWLLPQN